MQKVLHLLLLTVGLNFLCTTGSAQQTALYATDFNTNASGWTFATTYGGAFKWVSNVGVGATGGLTINEASNTTTPPVIYTLSTPVLALQAGNSYRVAWSAYGIINSKRAIRIRLNSTPNLLGTPINVGQTAVLPTTFTNQFFDFTAPSTGNFYLVFNIEKLGTNQYGKAFIDNVSVTPTNVPPTVSITSPANAANLLRGNNSVTVNAADANGAVTKVELFVNGSKVTESTTTPFTMTWNAATLGAQNIYAKATDNAGASTNSTSINVNVTNNLPTASISSPTNNASFNRGNQTILATANDADGTIAKVEFFVNGSKIGEKTSAPFDFVYNFNQLGTFVITAIATDNDGGTITTSATSVSITNILPTASISSPTNNATLTVGSQTITATATDADGTIAKVEFFASSTKIGETVVAPYTLMWNAAVGNYALTALATDNNGDTKVSTAVNVTVVNTPPTVSLTSPSANAAFIQGETIVLKANAGGGAISKVEFFVDGSKIGEDLTAPYELSYVANAIGAFSATATATNTNNVSATTAATSYSVTTYTAGSNVVATWNFNTNAAGWTLSTASGTHDWKWYATEGVNAGGGLRLKLPSAQPNNFAASPQVTLQAGSVYTVNFSAKINQSSVGRNIVVGYNTAPNTTGGFTQITKIGLPANSYAVPPFVAYNPSFTVPATGVYNLVFYIETAGYLYVYMDEVSIERNLPPTTSITSPVANASFNEPSSITINANAADADGTITKVEFFSGATKLTTLTTAPYTFTWANVLPGIYSITSKATDNRGVVTTSTPVSVTMNFANGTLEKFINWNFVNLDYWKFNGDWRLRGTGGRNNTSHLEAFNVAAGNFAISQGVQLTAGKTYKLSFFNDAGNTNKPCRFSYNTQQTLTGATTILNFTPLITDDFLLERTATFTVPTTGVYFLALEHVFATGTGGYQQLKFDDIRITGDLNVAPVSKITNPSTNITIAENANMLISAMASDVDGTVSKVEFYANAIKIGETMTSPYQFTWQNIPAGVYEVTAKPFDNQGAAYNSFALTITATPNIFSTSSYLGGSGNDEVRGLVYQTDGTIVMAANISDANPGGVTPTLLNGATATSGGAIIRLSNDGKQVLSVTRLSAQISDMDNDGQGNIYVAAGLNGLLVLNPTANAVNWSKTYAGQYVHRVDAGASGNSVVMTATETNPDDETIGGGVKIIAHTAAGIQLFANNGVSQYTSDVAIDEPSQTVVGIGFKNFDTNDALGGPSLPVYVPVYRGYDFAGVQKYVGYDWGKDSASPNWLNLAANNMADVRTSRCVIGADGKLYITFEVYGGNHILRYSPFNNTQTVPIVAGDMYFNFSNTGTEVKTFVGRYEPATGAYVLGQQFTARINPPLNKGNSVFARNGSVAADATGRVYLTGQSAFGIPITINHQPGEYLGGAFVLVLSPNLAVRESCIRLTLGSGKAIATNGNGWCYGGATSASLYAVLPLQATKAAGNDGFYAVVAGTPTPILAPNNIVAKTIKNNTLQNINVYPNPSNGLVNVSLENIKGDYTIQLTDVKGQVIYNQSGNAADNDLLQLNTDNLESGIYIVRFVNEGYSSARQLVIKK